uniref:Sphingomyelin phosphodiesterase n=1 Tax=Parastrongyloides trichosuri TaxID=131310 RepID=A0A0N4ZDK2_PARTI
MMILKIILYLFAIISITCAFSAFKTERAVNSHPEKLMKAIQKFTHSDETKGLACAACTGVVDGVQKLIKDGKDDEEVEDFLIKECKNFKIEQDYVCTQIIHQFAPEAIFFLTHAIVTPAEICGAFIKDCGDSENPLNDLWPFEIPGGKPATKPFPIVNDPQKKLRVLHLTDIHIDRNYTVGSEANCGYEKLINTDAFCCRVYPGDTEKVRTVLKGESVKAGYWGSPYKCDIPYRTFINAMEHISKNDKFDYIIVTGDLESHDIWDYTKSRTMTNIMNITSILNNYFPNTPIYQATGNHEGVPMDAMGAHSMPEYSTRGPQWLYNTFAQAWKRDLPASTQAGIKYRASYSIQPYQGLKLISLNTVYCSHMNLYNYINQTDPDGTLQWLSDELLASEKIGEKVHIISHIPPGESYCLKGWSFNFYKLVERFENTIMFIALGHTHKDHFEVYYENADVKGRPIQVNWIAPSLTTYADGNPSYRVYEIDGNYQGSSFTVLEAETYYTDVEKATEDTPPVWQLEYKFTEEYGMPDLSPNSFNELINKLDSDDILKAIEIFSGNSETKGLECAACTGVVDTLQKMIENGKTDTEIENFLIKSCQDLKIEEDYICDHIIHQFADEVIFVLTHAIVTPAEICGAFVKKCGVSENPLDDMWPFEIPPGKPVVNSWPKVTNPQSKLRVLHLTDIHIDRNYTVGSEANCGYDKLIDTDAFCCREWPADKRKYKVLGSSVPAGYWGSPYICDIPYRTFLNAMEHISKNDKFDYIIVTGDLESHDVWDYSRARTMTNILNITSILNGYFPNTPIYQATGNHEGVPMDSMGAHTMPEYSKRGPQWLYNTFAQAWKRDLPQETQAGIKYRASYSFKPFSGLKLISLNTVYCSTFNVYNYLNQTDPDGTLAWLSEELLASEKIGEKVHIITHIPPGVTYCLRGWSYNFYKLVNRFESTIAFLGMGHTHQDHFEVYYDDVKGDGRPTQVNWIAPSLTTYANNNPGYRVYEFDGNYQGSSFTVLEAETYYTDIKEATEDVPPVWKLEYKFTKEYGMTDLSPQSFNDLIKRFENDNDLFEKFHTNYYRNKRDCNEECKKKMICDLKTARSYDSKEFC